ncbi:MAG TPA: TetR/AcrR family transcriptional regulator [Rhodopila sp.]|jgi:AcrR family transcriptional regulator|nr:TetR/AcrR family transcriptional regulator [Rhodopila sp.]
MQDRRQDIIKAGLETLGEVGYAGFTQPRIAAKVGLRQSHLTYYFPTRADLLTAVAQAAIKAQLGVVETALRGGSLEAVATAVAGLTARHETTRILIALAQAADEEPRVRTLFRQLSDGIVQRIGQFLKTLTPTAPETNARLLHAVTVGLAVIGLATDRPDGARDAAAVLKAALNMLAHRIEKRAIF